MYLFITVPAAWELETTATDEELQMAGVQQVDLVIIVCASAEKNAPNTRCLTRINQS